MRFAIPIVASLSLAGNCGCVTEQYRQFKGTILHGNTPVTDSEKTYEIGSQFGHRPDKVELGLWGFVLPEGGSVVLLFDRAKVVANDYRLSNQTIRGVWYACPSLPDAFDWVQFLKSNDEQRQRSNQVVPLQGTVDVERWTNNIDLRVRFAVSSSNPESVGINGVINFHTDQEWHPLVAMDLFLSQFGIGSE